jgi:hypothetical protein
MSKCFITRSLRKFVIASVALGGLTVLATQPATAKKLNACQIKHSYCSERCIMKYDGAGVGACIKRTCDRQNPGCGPK